MKTFSVITWRTLAVLAFFATVSLAQAGKTNITATLAKTNAVAVVTNAGPVELPIPASTFELTLKPTKDPFFPLSLRQPLPAPTNASPSFSPSMFTLKGLSGSTENRLALINNRTLAAGENSEITTASGKIKIHLLAIKETSVVIQADAQQDPLEIFLRKGAQ